MSQISFADAEYAGKRKKTRREVFLEEMELVVPWKVLLKIIEPHYPVAGRGRRPYALESMLRVHLMQNWFALSDPAMEEALYEIASLRTSARLSLNEPIPDETTILNFRHLLEANDLAEDMLKAINALLSRKGLLLKRGSIVDATVIAAPSSTKNAEGERDPEMHQTKKGNQWCVSRTQAADLWCCTEDGSRPPEAGLQEKASNHPVLLRSKDVVVSDRAKVTP
jgi:IS5 family transposase